MPAPVERTSPVRSEVSLAVVPAAIEPDDSVVVIVGDALVTVSCSLFAAVHGLEARVVVGVAAVDRLPVVGAGAVEGDACSSWARCRWSAPSPCSPPPGPSCRCCWCSSCRRPCALSSSTGPLNAEVSWAVRRR